MLRTFFASLRVRLMLLALVVLVPALCLLAYVADQDRKLEHDAEKSKVLHLARLAAAEESQIIQSTRLLLQHLAQTPEARGATTAAACDEMMARQIRLYSYYIQLAAARPDGMRFCSARLQGQSIDLSGRIYFRRAVETRDFAVGDYQVGGLSGRPGVSFGYPALDATGELRGVVYATLNLDWLGTSLAHAQLPPQASLTVVDGHGNLLARFPEDGRTGNPVPPAVLKQMLAQGDGGTLEGVAADGTRRVWGFVPLHLSASGVMFVRVGVPVAAAYAEANRAFHRILLMIAAAALLILGAAWAGGERLVMRPVKKLTTAARRLREGNLGARTGLPHGDSEFGRLARVFDEMAGSIQSEEAALERLMAKDKEANEKLVAGMGELERLNREITQLSRMSQVLQSCQSVEEACTAVAQSGRILFPTEVASLYLMRSSRDHLEYRTGWGGTGADAAAALLAPEACWALRRGEIYRYGSSHDGLHCEHVPAGPSGVPYICVPLVAQGDMLGLLHIRFPAADGAPPAAVDAQLKLATTFAAQTALALANLTLREVLKQQSIRDPLTGLHNRRFLEESLEREMARAQRGKTPLAVIMADVDHFKRFNDAHGHDAGDAVLRSVAQALKSHVRGGDIACRIGGEEFVLVLPDSAREAAREKAESLRQVVAALKLSHGGQPLGTVTMSFGLAIFPEHGSHSAGLLQAADAALYRAKKEGRNRVEIPGGPRQIESEPV